MPVSTDDSADELKELKKSNQQLTQAIRGLIRDLGNLRLEVVDHLGTLSTIIREEFAEKIGSINAKLDAPGEWTEDALSECRGDLEASHERTESAFSRLRGDLKASQEWTERELKEIRVEVAEKFGSISAKMESFRGRAELALRVAMWRVGILIPLVFSLIGFGFWFTWHAAKLDSAVETLKSQAPVAIPAPKGR